MKSLTLYIARKIYSADDSRRRVSRPAMKIATAGVAISLAVMIISVSIVNAFKHTVSNRIAGFGSDIVVADFVSLQSGNNYPIQMNDSMLNMLSGMEHVQKLSRYAYKQGVLKTDNDFLGVMMKGIGPDYDTTFISRNMTEGLMPTFSDKESTGKMVVSKTIADKLRLHTGDRIFAYFIDDKGPRARKLTVSGIYETHLAQYDDAICFTDLYTCRRLNAWEDDQVSGVELRLSDSKYISETEEYIINNVNRTVDDYGGTYSSKTIYELSPQIFSWLDLLDINILIILALMAAVAAITMISGLLIIILERTQMIGILKTQGAQNSQLRRVFLWFAAIVVGRGLLWGNIIALALLALQKATGLVGLDPATYYIDTVPVEFPIGQFIIINIVTFVICIVALLAPAMIVAKVNPSKSVRFD